MIKRYSRGIITSIWSDENRFRNWLKVEMAVLQARAEAGEIPYNDFSDIQEKAAFSVKRIQELEADMHHDVVAFITDVGEHIGEGSKYFHQGLTSSDVLDTALALQLMEASNIIIEGLKNLRGILAYKAREYKHTPIAGRTHGVHAEITTFGLKLAGFYAEFSRGKERFETAAREVEYGKISGAVGTYSYLDPQIESRVMVILGLKPDPISTQIVQRDRHAAYLSAVALLGGTLERLALEIRHLARTEVGELLEPFASKQRGSSAMPHKKNPIICERICGLSRILRANALAAMENQALWHERDISHSSVERVIFPDSTILLDYMLERISHVIDGMSVFPDKMMRNIEITQGLIYSQKVLNALLDKGCERDEAYQWVQKCAMKARNEQMLFKEALKSDETISNILSHQEIEYCFRPELNHVDTIFERLGI